MEPAGGGGGRGLGPPCPRCAEGRPGLCYNVTEGPIEVGLQTGYCADTGGGWGGTPGGHPRQGHPGPESLTDEGGGRIRGVGGCGPRGPRRGATQDGQGRGGGRGPLGRLPRR